MGNQITTTTTTTCCDDDNDDGLILGDDCLISILVRLPIVSLLRFKSVCKSWPKLIESSFFTHLHHTFNSSSSSSSNFDTFILQASVDKNGPGSQLRVETEILRLSDSFESGSSRYGWSRPRSEADGWCWSTDDNDMFKVCGSKKDADDHVFKADDKLVLKLDSLGLPSCYKFSQNIFMVGSCNGLICLYDEEHMEVALWNPVTRQFRILPKPISFKKGKFSSRYYSGDNFVGFGFDIKTKDYKVVIFSFISISCRKSQGCHVHVQVYSLSTDSWRLLEGLGLEQDPSVDKFSPFGLAMGQQPEGIACLPGRLLGLDGLYLNGSCFFMAAYCYPVSRNGKFMISFDFTKEIITTVEFPDHDHTTQELFLTYLGGDKMVLFTIGDSPHNYENYDYRYYYEGCDIWVLNEHGFRGEGVNKESWTKLYSFQMKKRESEGETIPRGISSNGEFALLESRESTVGGPHGLKKKMKLYNLVTEEAKKDFLSCDRVMSRAHVYKPSIVSIIGGNGGAADRVIDDAM